MLEPLIAVDGDGLYSIRGISPGWGIAGPRFLKGETSMPPHKDLTLDEALAAVEEWKEFFTKQRERFRRRRRKR
tara:strand:- start:1481 stop:1702 length:222 start_codon:yes stop_codon:yes gene_type:complete